MVILATANSIYTQLQSSSNFVNKKKKNQTHIFSENRLIEELLKTFALTT